MGGTEQRREICTKTKSVCFPLPYAARQQQQKKKKLNILNRLMESAFVSNLGNME